MPGNENCTLLKIWTLVGNHIEASLVGHPTPMNTWETLTGSSGYSKRENEKPEVVGRGQYESVWSVGGEMRKILSYSTENIKKLINILFWGL